MKQTTSPTRKRKNGPKTFKDAYDILQTNATLLQTQQEPDIDNLMTIVEESITAYKVCQNRIESVQQALDSAFSPDDNDQ